MIQETGKRISEADPRLLIAAAGAFMVGGVLAPGLVATMWFWAVGMAAGAVGAINGVERATRRDAVEP